MADFVYSKTIQEARIGVIGLLLNDMGMVGIPLLGKGGSQQRRTTKVAMGKMILFLYTNKNDLLVGHFYLYSQALT
jgi:hypothetical protein